MAEWRVFHGWTDAELESRLRALDGEEPSFDERPDELTPERGFSRYHSSAVVAHEPPGAPLEDGPFMRARPLTTRYEFSDPRIVTAHFDPARPLLGRRMLLELRVLGLRYLMGTVVDAVRDESDARRSVFGFRYSTLRGHLESGSEWFFIEKDHDTGWVRFGIEASWRLGEMPNWWSEAGFRLLSPGYQRAWHRLAYVRLRRMLGAQGLPALPRRGRLIHSGAFVPAPSVYRTAVGGGERSEAQRRGRRGIRRMTLGRALGIGTVAGMRSALAPALTARYLARAHPNTTWLSSRRVARALGWMAAGELLVDKAPFVPDRTEPGALFGRAVSAAGAVVALSPKRRRRWHFALSAAGAAVASAFVMRRLRASVPVPGVLGGLWEDTLAAGLGRRFVG